MTRRYAWRTHAYLGAHLLEQRFATPAEAGRWRRDTFHEDDTVVWMPLTFVAVVDGSPERPTPDELHTAHHAWLFEAVEL